MTDDQQRILDAFPAPPEEVWGRKLSQATGMGAGRVLRALYALERDGFVESRWETPEECVVLHLPRRLYRITSSGLKERLENRQPAGHRSVDVNRGTT